MRRLWATGPGLRDPKVSGGDIEEATPDPIPNSEVKLVGADGTAREAVWESRTLPGFSYAGTNWPRAPHAARRCGASAFCAPASGVAHPCASTPARAGEDESDRDDPAPATRSLGTA